VNGTVRAGDGTLASRIAPALERIAGGAFAQRPFTCTLWDGSELPATAGATGPPLHLHVRSPRALAYVLHEPNQLGLGRAWVSGDLELDGDLEQLLAACAGYAEVRIGAPDRARIALLARSLGALPRHAPAPPAAEARLDGRRNSLPRARDAIRHHYGMPASFHRLLLGPSLVDSCAYYASERDTLEEAQERKLDLICRKLVLAPGERFLDLGCGWGTLLLHAARRFGVQAVGVTLSESQAQEVRERVREAGLDYEVEVRVADYREVDDGPFDKIASIGMYEHVGRDQLATYARALRALLCPGGLVLNQGVTRLGPGERAETSFVSRYVYPDAELHPISSVLAAFEEAGLEIRDLEALREHYPLTLRAWTRNLARQRAAAIAAAGVERERVWRLYLAGSKLAFERGEIGVFQTVAARVGAPHDLPLTRFAPRRAPAPRRRGPAVQASTRRR
jgi:cyclopropane-fatty-acyl-phospholipid synthase